MANPLDAILGNSINPSQIQEQADTLTQVAVNTASQVDQATQKAVDERSALQEEAQSQIRNAQATVKTLNAITADTMNQLNQLQEIKQDSAELEQRKQVILGDKNSTVVDAYDNNINSQAATETRSALVNNVQSLEQEVAALQNEVNTRGFFGGLGARFQLEIKQQDLLNAQAALRGNTSRRVASTQAFVQQLAANATVVDNRLSSEIAEASKREQLASDTYNILIQKRKLTQEDLKAQSQVLGLTESQMRIANTEVDSLIKKSQANASAISAIYQTAQLNAFLDNEAQRKQKAADKKQYNEDLQTDLDAYLAGINKEPGSIDAETLLQNKNDPLTFGFLQFRGAQIQKNNPFTGAMAAIDLRQELTPAQSSAIKIANAEIKKNNAQLTEQFLREHGVESVDELATKPNGADLLGQLQKKFLDPETNDPRKLAEIDFITQRRLNEINNKINGLITDGVVSYADMKSVLTNPTALPLANKYIPKDIQQFFVEGDAKNFDFGIGGAAPQEKINGTIDFISDYIIKQENESDAVDAQVIAKFAQGLAGLYTVQRRQLNVNGFPNLRNSTITGIKTFNLKADPLLDSLDSRINIENAGEWSILINRAIRLKRLQSKQAPFNALQEFAARGGF